MLPGKLVGVAWSVPSTQAQRPLINSLCCFLCSQMLSYAVVAEYYCPPDSTPYLGFLSDSLESDTNGLQAFIGKLPTQHISCGCGYQSRDHPFLREHTPDGY